MHTFISNDLKELRKNYGNEFIQATLDKFLAVASDTVAQLEKTQATLIKRSSA